MSNWPIAEYARRQEALAEVRAHDQVMRYRRLGAGAPLLLLETCTDDPLTTELRCALAESHRVIIPELPAADQHLASWLANFLEGIGTSRISVVVSEPFCLAALELVLLGNDQIARIIVVATSARTTPHCTGSAEPGLFEGATSRVSVPVLLVRCGQPMHEVVSLVREFLWL